MLATAFAVDENYELADTFERQAGLWIRMIPAIVGQKNLHRSIGLNCRSKNHFQILKS